MTRPQENLAFGKIFAAKPNELPRPHRIQKTGHCGFRRGRLDLLHRSHGIRPVRQWGTRGHDDGLTGCQRPDEGSAGKTPPHHSKPGSWLRRIRGPDCNAVECHRILHGVRNTGDRRRREKPAESLRQPHLLIGKPPYRIEKPIPNALQ